MEVSCVTSASRYNHARGVRNGIPSGCAVPRRLGLLFERPLRAPHCARCRTAISRETSREIHFAPSRRPLRPLKQEPGPPRHRVACDMVSNAPGEGSVVGETPILKVVLV